MGYNNTPFVEWLLHREKVKRDRCRGADVDDVDHGIDVADVDDGTNVDDVDHGADVDDVDHGAFSQFGEVIESKVCLIYTSQRSDLFRGSVPNGQDLDGHNITVKEAQSRGSGVGGDGGFRDGGGHREDGYGGSGCR
ncbi:glycine-rich RNA-binding protein 1-like [Camellia sinensis]|uniref:glycine-rich RNA-binding protein 1-like n=1 Tax=Camellia sinensis TaxID=4442 RepID=UPI001036E59C|nr:glycine-rich RNA-binding protein 1-like [Camellia sinensis]